MNITIKHGRLDIHATVTWAIDSHFNGTPEIEIEAGLEGDYEVGQRAFDSLSDDERRGILNRAVDQSLMNAETR